MDTHTHTHLFVNIYEHTCTKINTPKPPNLKGTQVTKLYLMKGGKTNEKTKHPF